MEKQANDNLIQKPTHFDYVPAGHMRGAVQRYIEQGIHPGGFMEAVICNDLRGAIMRADNDNIRVLVDWIQWWMQYAPASCWGSYEAMDHWIEKGGLMGSPIQV